MNITQTGNRLLRTLAPQLPKILVEMLSVIFAVLLALAVNDWREERRHAAEAREALGKITREIRANRDALRVTFEEQQVRLTQFREEIAALAETPEGASVGVELTAESLRDTGWKTTLVTGTVAFMDFETVARISDIYELQDLVDQTASRLLQGMTSVEIYHEDTNLPAFRSLAATYSQLIDLERQLLESYDEFLES